MIRFSYKWATTRMRNSLLRDLFARKEGEQINIFAVTKNTSIPIESSETISKIQKKINAYILLEMSDNCGTGEKKKIK